MSVEESSDLFLFSPSLFDILSYLSYKDIENARFVNRRMNDFIKRNEASWDRPTVSLKFTFYQERISGKPFVYSYYSIMKEVSAGMYWKTNQEQRLCQFVITEKRIRLIDFPPAILDIMLEKASTLPYDSVNYADRAALERFPVKNKQYPIDFENDNIEEGLRIMLQMLFRRFFLNNLEIEAQHEIKPDSIEANCIELMGEEFVRSRSRCDTLLVKKEFYGMERLYATMGTLVTLCETVNIEAILLSQRFDQKINIRSDVHLDLLLELVERWTTSVIPSIKQFTISAEAPRHDLLSALKNFRVVSEKETGISSWEIEIMSECDDMCLIVSKDDVGYLRFEEQ